ncbi:bifunctional transaldolase/phosoglucose isomerase [Bombella sp. ESL0385]|uniref:bifunctional transaldolase/phosoglucose isomerase n=1 Tax=Bombella sp. ESL0385 TaxID=2676446 RepID=UPI0012D91CC5|nr:bifunctional transaldolase/phosoglucose isomerase [Bombella sp. ESL0385]MUG89807.1 bifunctional transaldolase/phosoglucose isomerase [Bombella sp. ESL0385]
MGRKPDTPLTRLAGYGQSIWLDFIRRDFIEEGRLASLVKEDALKGVTSNPAIFEQAIGQGAEYEEAVQELLCEESLPAGALYEAVAVADIRQACRVLRPVFDETSGRDGYVSLEVSPYLADDAEATLHEARRLWQRVNQPNVMIKIPATEAALPAIEQAIAEGINVNITLLFAQSMYENVLEAYLRGLEARVQRGQPISQIGSVASFFVSRIDGRIDAMIDRRIAARDPQADALKRLRGKVAIANARMAYQHYLHVVASPRWQALAEKGAQTQRLLWASTSTKDKTYRDVLYVEELIGEDTVNTVPPHTLEAFRDHGVPQARLADHVEQSRLILEDADRLGLDLPAVTTTLLGEGVAAFKAAFDGLLGAVAARREAVLGGRLMRVSLALSDELDNAVVAAGKSWTQDGKVRRLWERDASVWTNGPESKWLGWLDVVKDGMAHINAYEALQREVKERGYSDVLLLAMGGSSLGPEVLAEIFGQVSDGPKLHVLDSTDPQQVASFAKAIDPTKTLFIVSSKSGSTLEPNILFAYFWALAGTALGRKPGDRFVAVTDPGSSLETVAQDHGFAHIFHGNPEIGGRYSVLSPFGLTPAAAAGYDVRALLNCTQLMIEACDASVPPVTNPGINLGLALGVAATTFRRDKVTFVASEQIASLGAWLEQLLAESTGKSGTGLIPIDGEPLGRPDVYSDDRIFVELRLGHEPVSPGLKALREAGHPVVTLHLDTVEQIVQAFFVFEFATAVAGSVLGIDPFDQPDVEFSKVETRKLTKAYAETGRLPEEAPFAKDGNLAFYADERNHEALAGKDAKAILKAHFDRVGKNDYIGLLAYIERNKAHIAWEQTVRVALREQLHVATAAQFGPRFLHSTGQAYKGGPNSGVFLQITADDAADLSIPGYAYSFGVVKAAQARGDFDVLASRGRRALRVHITGPLQAGLDRLAQLVTEILKGA